MTPEQPLVSVIVPTYNRSDMLVNTLKTVLAQTYRNKEIIVVNDAGQDVESLVRSIDPGIIYLQHKQNKGLAASRNTAISSARGKYIAYLDDDDVFYPHHLETLVHFLESSGYKVAYTDAHRIHQVKVDGAYVETGRDIPYSCDFDRDAFLRTNYVPVLCFMHEKSCIEEVGFFDESLKALEDWDLWIRMSRRFEFAHIREVTAGFTWRTDGSSMTSSSGHRPEWSRSQEIILGKYKDLHERSPAVFQHPQDTLPSPSSSVAHRVSIIILSLNQWEWTRACLESIRKHTTLPYEVIVVDNGSSSETVQALSDFSTSDPSISLILNAQNKGFAGGNNLGIAIAKGDYVLLLNNDTLVTAEWLEGLLKVFSDNPGVGIVGPMSNYVAGPQVIEHARYSNIEEMETFASHWREAHRGETFAASMVIGFCMLMRRRMIEAIGGLDELFGIGNFEDMDFCYRASLAGFDIRVTREVFIHHQGSLTFKAENVNYVRLMKKNWELFKAKWGLEPGLAMNRGNVVFNKELALRQFIALPHLQTTHECDAKGRLWLDKSKDSWFEGKQKGKTVSPVECGNGARMAANPGPVSVTSHRPAASTATASATAPPQVSVIIPTYENLNLTRQCLEGILHNTADIPHEIIVVDNHSTDGTRSYLQEMESKGILKAVLNPLNMGFARACNQGAQAARCPFLLFLNNDTFPMEGWMKSLLQTALRDESAAIIGTKLLYPDGRVQHAGMKLIHFAKGQALKRPIPGHPHRFAPSDTPEVNEYRELDMVTGACILVRKNIFFLLGGFDEVFRNGVEDVDLCLRARLAGYKVAYQPESIVIHHEGQSPGRFDKEPVCRNLSIYFARWGNQFGSDGRLIIPQPPRVVRSQNSILNNDAVKTPETTSPTKRPEEKGLRIC